MAIGKKLLSARRTQLASLNAEYTQLNNELREKKDGKPVLKGETRTKKADALAELAKRIDTLRGQIDRAED